MPTYVLDGRVITPHFPGLGRYAHQLARHLPPLLNHDEALVVLIAPDAAKPIADGVPLRGTPFSLRQQWEVPRTLRALNASVYHSLYLLMPYRPATPTMLSVNDLIPLTRPAESSLRARLFFSMSMALALRTAQQVVTISEHTRRDLLQRFAYPAERVHTIPLAADARFGLIPREHILSLREEYGLPRRFVAWRFTWAVTSRRKTW